MPPVIPYPGVIPHSSQGEEFADNMDPYLPWFDQVAAYMAQLAIMADGGTYVAQANAYQGGANVLLRAGAFGLGGYQGVAGFIGTLINDAPPGTSFWTYDANLGSTGAPADVVRGTLMWTRRDSTAGHTQVLVSESSIASALLWRSRVTGGWLPWARAMVQGSAPSRLGDEVTIADDAVATLTPPRSTGQLSLTCGSALSSGLIYYKADATPSCAVQAGGSALQATTGGLTGTSAVDGNTLVSARTDGTIQINNRGGSSRTYVASFL